MSTASASRPDRSANGVIHDLSCLISWTMVRARSWLDQKVGSIWADSSSERRDCRRVTSKKSPQFVGLGLQRLESFGHSSHVRPRSVRGARKQKA